MAPEASQNKRKARENNYIFDLGVRGRRTGLTLDDTGIRDENGLEPMDHLFSSPEKSTKKVNGRHANSSLSSDSMDIGESTVPEPTAVINERASMRLPPPRSRSPVKTYLQSPARRNPSHGLASSPLRGSVTASSVRRKLFFSGDNLNDNMLEVSTATANSSSLNKAASNTKASPAKFAGTTDLRSGTRRQSSLEDDQEEEEEEDEEEFEENIAQDQDNVYEDGDEAMQMLGDDDDAAMQDGSEVPEEKSDPEPELQLAKKAKGKGKFKEIEVVEAPVEKRGRKRKEAVASVDEPEPPAKRTRRSLKGPLPITEPTPATKPQAGRSSKSKAAELKSKTAAKKSKLAPIAEAGSPEVQRGPPLPRNSRGLLILRRETPLGGVGFTQTRSGRNSHKPLAYWKNERAEYSEDENEDISTGKKFLVPRIKGVVRADEVDERRPKRYKYSKSKGKKTAAPEFDDEDEAEAWEAEPGRIVGEIRTYNLEDPTGVETEEREEELALSSAAIITRDVGSGATFKFAKTLTLPFFGSGMVDLPPGGAKKLKNSRKMQMVFFVYYGRVEVQVNDTFFRIGKGGMWQVPRGNFYSITNDYDKPARIFFAQGCEVEDSEE